VHVTKLLIFLSEGTQSARRGRTDNFPFDHTTPQT
jgi:hypothetical protein